MTPPHDTLWPAPLSWFDLTLPTLAENLALDDVLLAEVEADPHLCGLLALKQF